MKIILHYVGSMNRGGMESMIMNIYREIDKSEYQFHFAVHTTERSDFDKEIEELGGKIITFPSFRKNPIEYKNLWSRFWIENKNVYNAFHYHTNSLANITAVKQAFRHGVNNIIIHSHSSYADKGKLQLIHDIIHVKNQYFVKRHGIKTVAASVAAANWLFGGQKKGQKKIAIINNGIDYKKYKYDNIKRIELRKKMNIEKELVVGHVGKFLPVKNHKYLFEVFNEIKKKKMDSILLLFGDGPLEEKLREYCKEINIEDSVLFMGNVSNVEEYLNILDVFVFPSTYEGLGMAAIEAQINGVFTVISDRVPPASIISEYAIQISLNKDATSWANVILNNYYRTIDFRKETELNDTFDIEKTIIQVLDLYDGEKTWE